MQVKYIVVESTTAGQRLDNFLVKHLKGVPQTRIYRAIRQGEVRVNKARRQPNYRLQVGERVRIPPLRVAFTRQPPKPGHKLRELLTRRILYEDRQLILINKPAGIPVHGGSGIHLGLIEALRAMHPSANCLELVHRLDRGTSGCLLIAKKRAVLIELHRLLTQRKVFKQYLTLVKGRWPPEVRAVRLPLVKNVLRSGERMVTVNECGKPALTRFRILRTYAQATLLEAQPFTGRTHQIRVHAAALGHPIAGDEKYGDANFNQQLCKLGLQRLFLHSAGMHFKLADEFIGLCALLDDELVTVLRHLTIV